MVYEDALVPKGMNGLEKLIDSSKIIARTGAVLTRSALSNMLRKEVTTFAMSLDVTVACNLRCGHCYLYANEDKKWELNRANEETHEHKIDLVKGILERNPNIIHATWVGGEPLMRKRAEPLTRRLTELVPFNWVVTNGTFPIPNDYNDRPGTRTLFVLSLDGPPEYHNALRGQGSSTKVRDIFGKAMDNVENTTARVHAHCVITSETKDEIPGFVKYLREETKIKGIRFSTYTPQIGAINDPLVLSSTERSEMVETLKQLKVDYGSFIWMSSNEIDYLRPELMEEVFGENCLLSKKAAISFDYQGDQKPKCVMGETMDCYNCGCTIPPLAYSLMKKVSLPTAVASIKPFFV